MKWKIGKLGRLLSDLGKSHGHLCLNWQRGPEFGFCHFHPDLRNHRGIDGIFDFDPSMAAIYYRFWPLVFLSYPIRPRHRGIGEQLFQGTQTRAGSASGTGR